MSNPAQATKRTYKLPPLILHPFSDANGPNKLVESSRASMMLQGLLPNNEFTLSELERKLLDGRFCEIRMLYYVGKDLVRWLEQCTDFVEREAELKAQDVKAQSFATMLIEGPPEPVKVKLRKWGVADYRAIFSRALGLNMVFAEAPAREQLAAEFIRNYYRFADHLFACFQSSTHYGKIDSADYDFDLFASGEYSRMLEREWTEQMDTFGKDE